MKTFKLIFTLLTVISLTSCTDVIQVKLDEGQPIVTVDAFINDMRSQQKVRLTYTDSYFSQKPNTPVKGATVVLKDLTTGQVYNFTDNANGDYVFNLSSADTIGRVDHTYELNVTHQGTLYSSTTQLNRTTQVDTLVVELEEGGGFREKGYYFSFLGFDPPGEVPDFYWIKSYRNGVFFNKGAQINVAWNGAYSDDSDGLPFILPISTGITPEPFNQFDVCRVEIHSINLETYNFLLQAQKQMGNSGLFATTPENVKTNIKSSSDKIKVVGWFCMSAVGVKEGVAQ